MAGRNRPRRSSSSPHEARLRWAAPLLVGVVIIALWAGATATGAVSAVFLPSPVAVLERLIAELGQGTLLRATLVTVSLALLGCLISAAVALPLGWTIARVPVVSAAVQPYLAASQAIPAVALAPLLVLWLGYGIVPIVVLCALLVFFPIVLSTVLGLRTLDPDVLDAARLDGAGGWTLVRYMEIPLAAPALMTGLRNGFTLSITGAVVGELVMGGTGLGLVLSVAAATSDTVGIFVTLVVLTTLAVATYLALLAIERAVDPLRPPRLPRTPSDDPAERRHHDSFLPSLPLRAPRQAGRRAPRH